MSKNNQICFFFKRLMMKYYAVLFLFLACITSSQAQKGKATGIPSDTIINNTINIKISDFSSDDDEKKERADSVINIVSDIDNLIDFHIPWKVKSGDDSSWASLEVDDSSWDIFQKDTTNKKKIESGIKWFRIHFHVDDSLIGIPLAFYIKQFGSAADVYLDGHFLKSYGVVGREIKSEKAEFSVNPHPYAIVFSKKQEHLFAVRYSDFNKAYAAEKGYSLGKSFNISIKNLNNEIADVADPSRYFPVIFFAAIFLTLAIVHFIMFVFVRQKVTNLFYSIYCLGIFMVACYAYYILVSTDYSSIISLSKLARYIAPLLVLPIVAMLHHIFYEKLLKVFWVLILLYILSIIGIYFDKTELSTISVGILFSIASFEILRVIIKSLFKKKDGAWIFAMVILLAPLLGIVTSFLPDDIVLFGFKTHVNSGAIIASSLILGLPFSMTLYLARDFARMSKKLNIQLHEITDLSNKTIEQEKERKKILEAQKSELEIKVVERTQEVWQQKEVIELKNKEITASLVYAKRIQSAILPDIKLIYKTLEQSFILYIPKDIVSGDFYGFAQKDGKVIIAAADCTGHGVSGAFMSMIGSSLLNQVINERNITQPSRILDSLNQEIITTLKQKDGDTNDGMDVSICSFDLARNTVHFAGANRPLWLIRNGELTVYRPDKYPIGGLQIKHEEQFSNQEIALQKNDTLYLFSDGYADQFGGDRNKKMMVKRFKNTILGIQDKTMAEQEVFLHSFFDHWKGSNEQVDDVLVIGIRI